MEYTKDINVAQILDAIVTYDGNQNIVNALTTLKDKILGDFTTANPDAKNCIRCVSAGNPIGRIGEELCPLCGGMTKTTEEYIARPVTVEYVKLSSVL